VNSIERALAILLLLSRRKLLSATELSRRFAVSVRTIYRDIDRLIALGIPVEAERGAEGGFRLAADFLAPPIALNRVETTALLVALTLVRGLKTTPLLPQLEAAEAKLLAALPVEDQHLHHGDAPCLCGGTMQCDTCQQDVRFDRPQSAVQRFSIRSGVP